MSALLNHVKQVAKDDVRLYFAPFVGIAKLVRKLFKRTHSDN